jgi:F-box protein 18 (helicase)
MTYPPTPEQQACIDAAVNTDSNLLISALAGAAKTTTLILIAAALPKTQILCLAFNKKIATEMAERLPINCTSKTLNSLGLQVWKDSCVHKVIVDTRKLYRLTNEAIDQLSPELRKEGYSIMAAVMNDARTAKSMGHVPDDCETKNTRLVSDAEMLALLEDEPTLLHEEILMQVLSKSCKEALLGRIDFDDMLLFPTCFRASFPRFPLILIDEAQDLSPLNHAMLTKLTRKRIIAVGDACQAIYGFRGASTSGMDDIQSQFAMTVLPLTTSFRCPEVIVQHVLWRAPEMKSWSGAQEGFIGRFNNWVLEDIPADCAIICRNNAPLYRLAMAFFASGRQPNLWGTDLTKGLVKVLRNFGAARMQQEQVFECIAQWEAQKLAKTRNTKGVRDRAECLRILARGASSLGGAIDNAENLSNQQSNLNLMTVHKSKGHEFRDVYILDDDLIGDEGQERNIRYVAATRTMNNLTYIQSDGRISEETS